MIKKRYVSIGNGLRTGITSKIFFCIGIILLSLFLVIYGIHRLTSFGSDGVISFLITSGYNDIFLAVAILCIGAGFFFWFLYRQFSKLAEIVDELEREYPEE
jgi:TRAP-type C4-dicarboxylate transport system permease small subunit